MGFNFFEPLTQFCGLLRKTTPLTKLFYLIKTILLPCFIISDLVLRYNSVTITAESRSGLLLLPWSCYAKVTQLFSSSY